MYLLFSLLFLISSIFSLLLSVYLFDFTSYIVEFTIPFISFFEIPISFMFDYVSFLFFSLISLISFVVFIYSKFYMDHNILEESINNLRFFMILFFFLVSMMILVFSNSWVCVMLGWDGLGLVSFILVIYFNNSSSLDSGLITVFTNRLGDCFFILSFMFLSVNSWFIMDFPLFSFSSFYFILILGMMTKSAQFPFSSWLPAAMAAPTPVSSLVHSSTLVTAGIYLMIRFNFLMESFYPVLMLFSILTMLMGGVCANYEKDFKKIIAMSTLSQLGFMMFSLCLSYWIVTFLHVMFHAFFKSSLFLSTGSLMNLISGDQDSRNFGSMENSFYSKIIFIFSSLSLMGFPFSLGFYSKDNILGAMMMFEMNFLSISFLLCCLLTVSYTLRIVSLSFFMFPSFKNSFIMKESNFFFLPVMVLFFISVFSGSLFLSFLSMPMIFSFMELIVGLLVITGGILLSLYLKFNFYFSNFSSYMMFISILASSKFSEFLKFLNFKTEYSWGELISGKGAYMMLNNFNVYLKITKKLYFLKIIFLLAFIFMMIDF